MLISMICAIPYIICYATAASHVKVHNWAHAPWAMRSLCKQSEGCTLRRDEVTKTFQKGHMICNLFIGIVELFADLSVTVMSRCDDLIASILEPFDVELATFVNCLGTCV